MTNFNLWLLSLQQEHKLNLMRDALLEKRPHHFQQLLDVFLKAPLNQGGVSTDTLTKAFGPDLTDPNFFTNGKRFQLPNA